MAAADRAMYTAKRAGRNRVAVATSDGWLRLDRLQLAGKGEQTGAAFLNGYPQIVGARLGMAKSEHE